MKKSNLLNSLILAALVVPGMAIAADVETTEHKEGKHVIPASAHTVTSNIGLVSNYLYRGVSQTGDKAAIQGGFDYAHASGFYAGAWGSSISWLVDLGLYNSSSLELDTYAGFKAGIAEDVSYDVGFLRYNYPGEYIDPQITANTNELYGALSWKMLTAKYSRSFTNLFGTADSKGSGYAELNASYSLADAGVTLGAHYGKQTVAGTGNSGSTYSDYNLKASKDFSGYTLGLMLSKTNIKGEKSKGVVFVTHAF